VGGKRTVVGGTAWGERLPKEFGATDNDHALTVWVTHHDIFIPGYEEAGRVCPAETPGIDLIVNGHIHRRLEPVSKGNTHWVTAGNITRRSRSDASREHTPAVVCLYPENAEAAEDPVHTFDFISQHGDGWQLRWVRVPHAPFDDVFHEDLESDVQENEQGSGFIADLRQLTARRTDSGAGLLAFLDDNLSQFDAPIAAEIMWLASEVTTDDIGN